MNGLKLLSEIKFYNDYSKYNGEMKRKQNWKERSEDVMNMHRYNPKFQDAFLNPEFEEMFNFAEEALKNKLVLGSQRVLQFAGEPIMKHNSRLYNCLTSYCDRVEVFQEAMYWLLSGCGVGLSFVKEHVDKLPGFKRRTLGTKTFVIPDSIEGWSDAIGVLVSSYVTERATFPEFTGYEVKFDYSLIRPKGAFISGGFKAPGHGGLKLALERIESLLEKSLNNGGDNFRPIIAYDILMFAADAVLSGGVRRSATIALFSPEDEEMMNAKTGNWYMNNPQRARSNNSALLVRNKTPKDLFSKLINSTRQFGEPGFVFAESNEVVYNPCLIGSSLITTKSGVKTIKELSEMNTRDLKKVRVLTYNEETESIEYKKIKHAIKTKLNTKTLNIKFSDGSELNSTPDHKIFVEGKGWVEAMNLTKDDVILSFEQDNSKYVKQDEATIIEKVDTNLWTNLIYEDMDVNPWSVDKMKSELSEEEKELASKLFIETSGKVKIKDILDKYRSTLNVIKREYESGVGYKVLARDCNTTYTKMRRMILLSGAIVRTGYDISTEKTKDFRSFRVSGSKNPWAPIINTEHFSICGYYTKNDGDKVYLRSATEYIFAKWLDSNNFIWKHEPKVFKRNVDGVEKTYRPDFFTYDIDGNVLNMYEIKGGNVFDKNIEEAKYHNVEVITDINKYTKIGYLKELDIWKHIVNFKSKKVISVSEDSNFDVYDMSIEDNRNFFANGTLVHNCVEIGMIPRTVDYRSGWQGCNLCEINGGKMNNREVFLEACKAAAILGTLQAAYTDFRYVSPVSKEIFDWEALLGVSITGFMNNPKTLLDADILKEGAEIIKAINKKVAAIIGIRPAARTTCVKPSGNASVLLETTSGIHGDHASTYFRVMQINKSEEIAKFLMEKYPDLLEESVWSATNADYALFIPIKAKDGSIFKKDLLGVKQLDMVKLVQNSWVESGTNVDLCIQPYLRHNVSNTISVDNWEEVADYIWDNQSWIAGISLLPHTGDKIYNQAPFTETLSPNEIIKKYGDAALLVSGLIVDGLHLFDDNLWKACDYLSDKDKNMPLEGTRTQVLLKKDWLKRAKKFATRFDSMEDLVYCMKDVHLFHKWMKTERIMRNINIEELLANIEPEYVDVDTLGSVACAGSNCEITSL